MANIGFFGLTANPPHIGHVDAVTQMCDKFDEVWVSPSYSHAFNKPDMAPYEARVRLTHYVFNYFLPPELKEKVKVKELDFAFYDTQGLTPVYTYDLMVWLKKINPLDNITLILGEDNKEVLSKYYKSEKLQKEFSIAYAVEAKSTHSTQIRAYLKNVYLNDLPTQIFEETSAKPNFLLGLYSTLGPEATKYILTHNLYGKNHERKNLLQC